jgi:D-alanine-D-alanine ligase
VTEGQNEYVLEVNTLPGMTPTSLLPKIAAAAGFDFDSLCGAILERARLHTGVPRHERAAQSSFVTLAPEAEVAAPARSRRSARAKSA